MVERAQRLPAIILIGPSICPYNGWMGVFGGFYKDSE